MSLSGDGGMSLVMPVRVDNWRGGAIAPQEEDRVRQGGHGDRGTPATESATGGRPWRRPPVASRSPRGRRGGDDHRGALQSPPGPRRSSGRPMGLGGAATWAAGIYAPGFWTWTDLDRTDLDEGPPPSRERMYALMPDGTTALQRDPENVSGLVLFRLITDLEVLILRKPYFGPRRGPETRYLGDVDICKSPIQYLQGGPRETRRGAMRRGAYELLRLKDGVHFRVLPVRPIHFFGDQKQPWDLR